MRTLLLLMLAGGLGSGLRYFIGLWGRGVVDNGWPLGTLLANLLGAFLIGVASAALIQGRWLSEEAGLVITTGFLGGLTTFSSFAAEGQQMLMRRDFPLFAAYTLGSLALGLFAVWAGMRVVSPRNG